MGGGGQQGKFAGWGIVWSFFSICSATLLALFPQPHPPPPLNFLGKYLCQKLGGVVGCLEVGCDLVPSLLLRRPFDTIDKVFS